MAKKNDFDVDKILDSMDRIREARQAYRDRFSRVNLNTDEENEPEYHEVPDY